MTTMAGKLVNSQLVAQVAGVVAVAGIGYLLLKYVTRVPDAINPTSPDNLAYKGVNAVGSIVTGKPNFDLGTEIYKQTNVDYSKESIPLFTPWWHVPLTADWDVLPDWRDLNITVTSPKVITETLNPASDKNIVYKSVNAVGSAISGNKNFDLGGWIYSVFN